MSYELMTIRALYKGKPSSAFSAPGGSYDFLYDKYENQLKVSESCGDFINYIGTKKEYIAVGPFKKGTLICLVSVYLEGNEPPRLDEMISNYDKSIVADSIKAEEETDGLEVYSDCKTKCTIDCESRSEVLSGYDVKNRQCVCSCQSSSCDEDDCKSYCLGIGQDYMNSYSDNAGEFMCYCSGNHGIDISPRCG